MENFKKLLTGTQYQYDQTAFTDYRQRIDTITYFDSVKAVDQTYSKECADVLNLFFRDILRQPYHYFDALALHPGDELKQKQYLYDNIELAKDKFNYPGRGIQRICDQLEDLFKNDRPAAQRLFEEIQRLYRQLIRKDLNYYSFQILHFNLKDSPSFVELMDFMQYVESLANRPYIPITEPPQRAQPEQFAERWYGITYKIMQGIGVEKQFIEPTDKAGIMQFGKSRYKLETNGQQFYKKWKDFDFSNIPLEVKNFPKKDRHRWKDIVLTISENRAEVALWLKKQAD